jgi:hypothetical protein
VIAQLAARIAGADGYGIGCELWRRPDVRRVGCASRLARMRLLVASDFCVLFVGSPRSLNVTRLHDPSVDDALSFALLVAGPCPAWAGHSELQWPGDPTGSIAA